MEKTIIIQSEQNKPIQDFIKDNVEVLETRTKDGIPYFVLREDKEPANKN